MCSCDLLARRSAGKTTKETSFRLVLFQLKLFRFESSIALAGTGPDLSRHTRFIPSLLWSQLNFRRSPSRPSSCQSLSATRCSFMPPAFAPTKILLHVGLSSESSGRLGWSRRVDPSYPSRLLAYLPPPFLRRRLRLLPSWHLPIKPL